MMVGAASGGGVNVVGMDTAAGAEAMAEDMIPQSGPETMKAKLCVEVRRSVGHRLSPPACR